MIDVIGKLKDFGYTEYVDNPFYVCKKDITEPDEDGNCVSIRLTSMFNVWDFVLALPDGSMILLNIGNTQDVNLVEHFVRSFVPNY